MVCAFPSISLTHIPLVCSLPFWCLNSASGHAEHINCGETMLLTSCLNSNRIHKMYKSSLSAKGPDPIDMFKEQRSNRASQKWNRLKRELWYLPLALSKPLQQVRWFSKSMVNPGPKPLFRWKITNFPLLWEEQTYFLFKDMNMSLARLRLGYSSGQEAIWLLQF